MKLAAVVLFTVFTHTQCLSDEQKELLKKWHMECFEETKVSPDLVLKLKTGDWRLDNKLLKKWTLCILRKYDLMSDEGVFRLDNALAMVPDRDKEMIEDFIDECLPKKASAPYEIAWDYTKCYHTMAKKPKNKDKRLHYLNIFY
ncbi:uncharacterized protein LOC135081813 [Ostrinia nubilalis]|uniref:uncharacterized protein LOC114351095 n=1 Tax=Ostrinia furnacalis TaxID=93504 RepID=UPI001038ABE8|nr:uncharacterized protein LOC114351095 [Ostrinia furnacalis]